MLGKNSCGAVDHLDLGQSGNRSTNVWLIVGNSITSWYLFFGAIWHLLCFEQSVLEFYPLHRLMFMAALRYGEIDGRLKKILSGGDCCSGNDNPFHQTPGIRYTLTTVFDAEQTSKRWESNLTIGIRV